MRALILIGCLALGLAACRNNDQADNTANVDASLTAENITSNDVTAIDAVTGSDANMAADLNYVPGMNSSGGNASGSTASKSPSAKAPSSGQPATSQPATPAQNTTAPAPATNTAL